MKFLSIKFPCLLLFVSLLAIISCNENEIIYPDGGAPYLKNISSRDSNNYFLPIRHLIPGRDSFIAFDARYFLEGFNEKNLSLQGPDEDIFRFVFDCGFCGKAAIIKLTKNEIVFKKSKNGYSGVTVDPDVLSPIEKEHYRLIERYYPFSDPKYSSAYKKYFDSILKVYPQLLNQVYFEKLRMKARVIHNIPLDYATKNIPITSEKFKYFVGLINNSEFWQRSYSEACAKSPSDGDGFSLEAATKKKYNFVNSNYCLDDEGQSKFKKAIDELLKYINFDLQAFYNEGFPK